MDERIKEINNELDKVQELLHYRTQVENEATKLIAECRFTEAMEILKKI